MAALEVLTGVVAVLALLVLRGFALARARGTIVCRVRDGRGGWKSGVARYVGGELHWIPFLGLGLRPRHAIARRGLTVSSRRMLGSGEGPAGYWTVVCSTDRSAASTTRPVMAGSLCLAMSEDALTGFLAWLESAPPSAHLDAA
ncbi:DUF2550 family protein [Microbispora triticiradicis]|uniref:DUF2550 family protein n=2 Tax=Microbispora TaxID=2005 RepID=A0ABY3LX67_9ACTN|nr:MULTISPECIES: DUF2550 family protein [Microbispora]TLP55626.1 DUF2550 family protein [Microbispora fusca]TYB57969.1 DUF2550 family protein [Microbispora tritici]